MGDISVATTVKCGIMTSRRLGKSAPGPQLAKAKVLGRDVHGKFEYNKEVREEDSGRDDVVERAREQITGRILTFISAYNGKYSEHFERCVL